MRKSVLTPNSTPSDTDWGRVLAYSEGDAIPYEPEDGPYDPNDSGAARAWLAKAKLIRRTKEEQLRSLETDLIHALQAKELAISFEELNGRNPVTVLREKLKQG